MPSKYPVLKPEEIIRRLEKKGTLKSILNQAHIELDEFMKL